MIRYLIIATLSLLACVASLSVSVHNKAEQLRDLRAEVAEQSRVIDSLLTLPRTQYRVALSVRDESVFKIYGRYNKGTITVPNERNYKLTLDSCSFITRND